MFTAGMEPQEPSLGIWSVSDKVMSDIVVVTVKDIESYFSLSDCAILVVNAKSVAGLKFTVVNAGLTTAE